MDLERLAEKGNTLRLAVANLRRLVEMPETAFLGDRDKAASLRYHIVLAAEAAVEIAGHLISRRGFRAPRSYKDAIDVLHEEAVIEEAVRDAVRGLAGVRNLVVHRYWEVDDTRLRREIGTALPLIEAFLAQVGSFIGADVSRR
ncbi:MAG: DUF86 domain-containing protein [Myxococcota bacterium]|nr:DUF86 domain-containing protein [Myxococcota bacterium]